MDNTNSTELEAKNQAENETLTNGDDQTTEDGSNGNGTGDGEKQEESPYAKQLREMEEREAKLKADLEKSQGLVDKKEETIQALKKAKKEPVIDEADLEERILAKIRSEQQQGQLQSMVAKITADPTEQAVILKHYQSSIVKSGNLEQDLVNAVAIANSHMVVEQKRNRAIEEQREDFLTSFTTPAIRGVGGSATTDPIQRAAEELVGRINPNAVKNVAKQFQN